MAIFRAVDRLRPLLLGIRFTIVTDCRALVSLNAQRTQKPQIVRRYDLIQEFDFAIKHRPETKMLHVDCLGHGPVGTPDDTRNKILEERFVVCSACSIEDQVLIMEEGDEGTEEASSHTGNPRTRPLKRATNKGEGVC